MNVIISHSDVTVGDEPILLISHPAVITIDQPVVKPQARKWDFVRLLLPPVSAPDQIPSPAIDIAVSPAPESIESPIAKQEEAPPLAEPQPARLPWWRRLIKWFKEKICRGYL